MTGFHHLGDEEIHTGVIHRFVRGSYAAPDGSTFVRDVIRSPGAVAVVPVLEGGDGSPGGTTVRLVHQYRSAYDRYVVEVPAGTRDKPGEAVSDTGHRELAEEAGLAAAELIHLTDLLPMPGMTDSVVTVFLAVGCTPVPQDVQGVEEEHMELLDIPFAEALEMVERGAISDAKSLAGLLLTARKLFSF